MKERQRFLSDSGNNDLFMYFIKPSLSACPGWQNLIELVDSGDAGLCQISSSSSSALHIPLLLSQKGLASDSCDNDPK